MPVGPTGETPVLLRLHDLAGENIELTIFFFSHFGNFKRTNFITAYVAVEMTGDEPSSYGFVAPSPTDRLDFRQ
jgi:hypothetical protein